MHLAFNSNLFLHAYLRNYKVFEMTATPEWTRPKTHPKLSLTWSQPQMISTFLYLGLKWSSRMHIKKNKIGRYIGRWLSTSFAKPKQQEKHWMDIQLIILGLRAGKIWRKPSKIACAFFFPFFLLQFKRVASNVCLVARTLGCGGMEPSVYDDRSEQRKLVEYWLILNLVISEKSDDDSYNKL